MPGHNSSEHPLDDNVTIDAEPCTALVPVASTAQWSRVRPLPRPDSNFLSQLIADSEPTPLARSVRRANAAYAANGRFAAYTGLRARQIV